MAKKNQNRFLGITTIGEKGQVVIPAEARTALKLTKGDKLIVMNPHGDAIILMKASGFESFASQLVKRLASVKKLIAKKPRSESRRRKAK